MIVPNTLSRLRHARRIATVALAVMLCGCAASNTGTRAANAKASASPIGHVFVIVLENQPFSRTFGAQSPAPYLAHQLTAQGALLEQYYGIGHLSLDNYIAMISGQAPNPATQHDCRTFSAFKRSAPRIDATGQLTGEGCVYPSDVQTLPDQLEAAGLDWRGYMEGMGDDPSREAETCAHPAIGSLDDTRHASKTDRYATKHNPFMYFHSIIDDKANCSRHVVNLRHLQTDLATIQTTPHFAFITPDLCHDGHNQPCANGEPGGLESADAFLKTWVPRITASPAFQKDGLLVITFDEGTDGAACCGEIGLPGGPLPGRIGPGGGRIGAVLLSPWIKPGTVSAVPYNHYSLLRTVEDAFDLPHLGYAGQAQLQPFGHDIFTNAPAH